MTLIGWIAAAAAQEVVLDGALDATTAGAVVLRLTTMSPPEATITLPQPVVEGLSFQAQPPSNEVVAGRRVQQQSWIVTGKSGRYILDELCAKPASGSPVCATPLYLDLGQKPDRSAMADITEPEAARRPIPWPWIAAAAAAVAGAFGAWRWWSRRPKAARPPAVAPTEAPHLAALRRWDAIRFHPDLGDFDKALALSEIFRAYTEAVLQFPARALSTTEALAHLEALPHLARENLPRARRLLRATDRVKYAEVPPGPEFFEELDADLRAFIASTTPAQPAARS